MKLSYEGLIHREFFSLENETPTVAFNRQQEVILAFLALDTIPTQRGPSVFEQRLQWEQYASKHCVRGTFERRVRMQRVSFDKLVEKIRAPLSVNPEQASNRGGPIIPEVCLYCTLRWLSGGSYLDVTDIAGVSTASFYRILWKTIRAIIAEPSLGIVWPKTLPSVNQVVSAFTDISDDGVIDNCAGVVDGYLARIRVPVKRVVGNVRSYFSGHYQCYGVNVQAVADSHSRFLYSRTIRTSLTLPA